MRSIILLALIVFSFTSLFANDSTEWHDELSARISSQLAHQMDRNSDNDRLGASHLNRYVIEVGSNWESSRDWIDERGHEENRIFSSQQLDLFNEKLLAINTHQKLITSSKALYVVVVNNWKLSMISSIFSPDGITSLEEIRKRSQAASFDSLRAKMSLVPMAVEHEVRESKHREQVYIYLLARFMAYVNDGQGSVNLRTYSYTSFPRGDLGRALKNVTHLASMSKAELVGSNIEICRKYFLGTQAERSLVSLAYNFRIPKSESANTDSALHKEMRIINDSVSAAGRSIYDYSNLIAEEDKLNALESSCRDLRSGAGNVFMKIFYTDYRQPASRIESIRQYTTHLGSNDLVVWVHLNDDQNLTGDVFFGPGLEAKLSKNALDHIKAFMADALSLAHRYTALPVRAVTWIAGTLSKLVNLTQIDRRYWDPTMGVDYDPSLFILYYMNRSVLTGGSGVIARTITSDEDDFNKRITEGFHADYGDKQYEFAFTTGLWNGVARELSGVLDAVKVVGDAYTDPPTGEHVTHAIIAMLNGQMFSQMGDQLVARYDQSNSHYQKLHHLGSDVVAAAALIVIVGEVSGISKTSLVFERIAKLSSMMDLLALSQYAIKTVQGVKLFRMAVANGRYFFQVVQRESNVLLRLTNQSGEVLKNTDLSLFRTVTARGSVEDISYTLLVDPTERLGEAITSMKQLVKDAYGNRAIEFTDETGTHIGIEVKNAGKIADDAGELALLLNRIESKIPEALRPAFRSDFGDNIEMLRKFESNEGLVESWKSVSKHADLRVDPKFLENISDYSDDLLKQLDDDLVNPKWADELKAHFIESADDVTNVWKKLKEDPSEAWEISKADPAWEKWSQREFFKDVTLKGKVFERDVCLAAFKNRLSAKYLELKNKISIDLGKNLDDYDLYSQVQLKYDGDNYFVADQLFVKRDPLGDIEDIIIIENKLVRTTPLTPPQANAFEQILFTVRSVAVESEFKPNTFLIQNTVLKFYSQKQWYKAYDGNNGEMITGIQKM